MFLIRNKYDDQNTILLGEILLQNVIPKINCVSKKEKRKNVYDKGKKCIFLFFKKTFSLLRK
jgi:hypothetical protein